MGGGTHSPSSLSKPKSLNRKWIPVQDHPIFNSKTPKYSSFKSNNFGNLAAFDAASSRLYLWDPHSLFIHRLLLRFSDDDDDGDDERDGYDSSSSSIVLAALESEKLVPDIGIKCVIHQISLDTDGSSLILSAPDSVFLMILYEKVSSSSGNIVTYRTSNVGSQIFSAHNNGLQVLQVLWHPYSSTHVGILSSDSVLRLFDLSSELGQPEQEFYLQPFEHRSCHNAVSICPVAFSFGDQHLWDRFSIFVLFSDGSTYVLCPVVPFGSICSWTFIRELHEDVKVFGLKSSNANVISNSSLALDWLESTFPESDQSLKEGDRLALRAHPYAPVDASLTLQGPLCKVHNSEEKNSSKLGNADCEGKAVSFLYSSIGKDSVLAIAWSSGQLQIDALANEIQPLWNFGNSPRLRVDSYGCIKGVAMICESHISNVEDTIWLGPPLLRLAIVDLALPKHALDNCFLLLFQDPLLSERFYCLHGAGMDLIYLHFLPFSNLLDEMDKIGKEPSVIPVLATSYGESGSPSALCGFVAIADMCGNSQLVGITSSFECIVLESKGWTESTPFHYDIDIVQPHGSSETADISGVISKEILSGPKAIAVPAMSNLRSLSADSIEGRSILHQYVKLFHENYVEYAHKAFIELEHHEDYLKAVIDNQIRRISEAKQSLLIVESKQQPIKDRIDRAFKVYELLEQRLQNFRMLPGAKNKPLSRAEREFKAQLERFEDVESDTLHSSIEALKARLRRFYNSSPVSASKMKAQSPGMRKSQVSNDQMQKIKSTLEKLSDINNENTKKVNLIEHGLKSQEKD